MRIALFIPELRRGGVETVFLRLAAGFAAAGHEVDLVVAEASGPLRQEVPAEVSLVDLGGRRVLRALAPLVRYIRRRAPAVLVSGEDHANVVATWAGALARRQTAVVVTAHSPLRSNTEGRRGLTGRGLPLAVRLTYPRADAVVAVSENVAVDLRAIAPGLRDSIITVANPTVPSDLAARAARPSGVDWLDRPDGVPTLLAVGRLDEVKDYPMLLDAVARLRSQRPVRLLILGDGPLKADILAEADRLGIAGDVRLMGDVPDPYPFYARAQLTCISSRFEAGPMVLVESIASGVPVVSTDCSSLVRLFLGDQLRGSIVPLGDSAAMASAIFGRLVQGPNATAPPELLRQFLIETSVAAYLRLFESIIATPR